MTVKITFQMIVFNADAFLEPVLRTIKPFGNVVVTEGPVKYFADRGATTSTDRTNEILARLLPASAVVRGQWEEKTEMMAAAEHLIPPDTTHVWMVDADEVWPIPVIQTMLSTLEHYDSVSFKPYSFFGGFNRYLTGFEEAFDWVRIQRWYPGARWATHRPPTVNAPDGRPWRKHRHLACPERFYHYSYVMPAAVRAKTEYYGSWGMGTIPDYFNTVYLPWVVARSKQERQAIEDRYKGVHEWLPTRRGDCYTTEFTGQHPPLIASRLPEYKARINKELLECLTNV